MVVKKIQYHDLEGDLREDDFYFSMNETQFARANAMFPGGLQDYAMKAAKDKNPDSMFRVIDTLVRESYGEFVDNRFVKTAPNGQKLADFFINTEAYDNLLTELMQSEDNLMTFLTACLNKNAQDRVKDKWTKFKEDGGDAAALSKLQNELNKEEIETVNTSEKKPSLAVINK